MGRGHKEPGPGVLQASPLTCLPLRVAGISCISVLLDYVRSGFKKHRTENQHALSMFRLLRSLSALRPAAARLPAPRLLPIRAFGASAAQMQPQQAAPASSLPHTTTSSAPPAAAEAAPAPASEAGAVGGSGDGAAPPVRKRRRVRRPRPAAIKLVSFLCRHAHRGHRQAHTQCPGGVCESVEVGCLLV